jgi:hypothetical protein
VGETTRIFPEAICLKKMSRLNALKSCCRDVRGRCVDTRREDLRMDAGSGGPPQRYRRALRPFTALRTDAHAFTPSSNHFS